MNAKKAIQNIETWIEWLLLQSSFAIPGREEFCDKLRRPKFKWFNPAFLIEGTDWLTGEDYGFWSDATPAALDGPVNQALAVSTPLDDGTHNPMKAFQISHMRVAPLEAWRGKPMYPERYLDTVYLFEPEQARWYAHTLYLAKVRGKYVNVSRHGENDPLKVGTDLMPMVKKDDSEREMEVELDRRVRTTFAVAFTSEYFWHCDIGWDDHPKIRLPMTADRALKLFALRDTPTVDQRRKALLHWITGHVRVVNRGEENEKLVKVMPHLKGVYDFGWKGLNVSVYPSMSLMRDAKKKYQAETPSVQLHKERVEATSQP